MKRVYLALAVFFGAATMALGSDVTFRVDMNSVSSSFTTPEVNGNFNGWCGSCNALTDADNDGVWGLP